MAQTSPPVSEFVTSKSVSITLQARGAGPGEGSPEGDRSRPGGTTGHNERDHVLNEIENKTKTLGKEKITGKRRYLSAEKKYQLFIEAERGGQPLGEILRREGLYSSDLARIRDHVKEGALERLRARPGPKPQDGLLGRIYGVEAGT